MKKALFFLLTLAVGILIGYVGHLHYENHHVKEINRSRLALTPEDSLKAKVWNGDTEAYAKLQGAYRDYPPQHFLFWAMYMANKYDYAYAYEDVFRTMQESYYNTDSAVFKMDNKTRQFALGYLKTAAQKGDTSAVNLLNELKKQHVPDEWLK
jgi:hypothetical protein